MLRPLDAVPVENRVGIGTPDVNCIAGWLELKWLRRWPKNRDTIVRIDHYTVQQRRWLKRRAARGGGAWLLLQVGQEWLLFDALVAHDDVGRVPRDELYRLARHRWQRGLVKEELIACLQASPALAL